MDILKSEILRKRQLVEDRNLLVMLHLLQQRSSNFLNEASSLPLRHSTHARCGPGDESAAKQDSQRRQKHPAGRINVFGGP